MGKPGAITFEDKQGVMRTINARDFFTKQTPDDNLLKHVTNAVKDSGLLGAGRSRHSAIEMARLVLQHTPLVECWREGPRKVFADNSVHSFIRASIAAESCAIAEAGVNLIEGLQRKEPVMMTEVKRSVKESPCEGLVGERLEISVLRFSSHRSALHDALLNSDLAQEAMSRGIEIQPSWAIGAKVFVEIAASALPEDFELQPDHVVVISIDIPRIQDVLRSLPYKQRPKMKESCAVMLDTPSEEVVVEFQVERTFIHYCEHKSFTPRSAYARSSNDRVAGHSNPRAFAWPGCEWDSCAEAGSILTESTRRKKSLEEHIEDMKHCQRRRDLPGLVQCYSSILRDELKPDIWAFTILIDVCAKAGDCEEAERWVQKMEEHGVPLGQVTFNCLINAHAMAGKSTKAAEWLARMEDSGVTPSLVSYNCIIKGFTARGDVPKATEWLQKASEAHRLNLFSYAPFVSHFGRQGLPQEAEEWFAEAMAAGVEGPHRSLFGHVVVAYANARDLHGARAWCQKLLACGGGDLQVWEYTQLLKACSPSRECAKKGMACAAAEIFREQLGKAVAPDQFNLTQLAKAVGAEAAEALCKELGVDIVMVQQQYEAMRDELGVSTWYPFQIDDDGTFKRYWGRSSHA